MKLLIVLLGCIAFAIGCSGNNGGITHLPSASIIATTTSGDRTETEAVAATAAATPIVSAAINAGGGADGIWHSDEDYSGGSTSIAYHTIDTSHVSSPAPQAVYQSYRGGNFSYTIPNLTAGAVYGVELHFAEDRFTETGQRLFNVSINGTPELTNFDIFKDAGGRYIADEKSFPNITADSTGKIKVIFTTIKDNSLVAGIYASHRPSPSPSPSPSPAGGVTLTAYSSCLTPACANTGPRVAVGPQASITCAPSSVNFNSSQSSATIQSTISGKPSGTNYCFAAGTYTQPVLTFHNNDVAIGAYSSGTPHYATFDGGSAINFGFLGGATGVTIKNFVVQHYAATNLQDSPFHALGSAGWKVYNNELAFNGNVNGGVGISTSGTYTVVGNYIHDNQTSGYVINGNGTTFTDNDVYNNNPQGTQSVWSGAGGGKTISGSGVVISYNYVHSNWGAGIWEDADEVGITITHNDTENNKVDGIIHEVSWDAVVQYNYVAGNGVTSICGTKSDACAGIFISSSGGETGAVIDISNNTVIAGGGGGIGLLSASRGSGTYGVHKAQNVHVHNNNVNLSSSSIGAVFGGDDATGTDGTMFTTNGNSFDYDAFVGAGTNNLFYWGPGTSGTFMNFARFQSLGQETHGTSN